MSLCFILVFFSSVFLSKRLGSYLRAVSYNYPFNATPHHRDAVAYANPKEYNVYI
jgi:hypothetical protein